MTALRWCFEGVLDDRLGKALKYPPMTSIHPC